jgi:hypothetical protein
MKGRIKYPRPHGVLDQKSSEPIVPVKMLMPMVDIHLTRQPWKGEITKGSEPSIDSIDFNNIMSYHTYEWSCVILQEKIPVH